MLKKLIALSLAIVLMFSMSSFATAQSDGTFNTPTGLSLSLPTGLSGVYYGVEQGGDFSATNPKSIQATADKPYVFTEKRPRVIFFVTGDDGKIDPNHLTGNDEIQITPSGAVHSIIDSSSGCKFALYVGSAKPGQEITVTVRGNTFKVVVPEEYCYDLVSGTTLAAGLFFMDQKNMITASNDYTALAVADQTMTDKIGLAFYDTAIPGAYRDYRNYQYSIEGLEKVEFYAHDSQKDRIATTGEAVYEGKTAQCAEFVSSKSYPNRISMAGARVSVNGATIESEPFVRKFQGFIDDEIAKIEVPLDVTEQKLVYFSSINRMIEAYGLEDAELLQGKMPPELIFAEETRIIANPEDGIEMIDISKPVRMLGRGNSTQVFGAVQISCDGTPRINLENMRFAGNVTYQPETGSFYNRNEKLPVGIGGKGICQLRRVFVTDFKLGVDMGKVDKNNDGLHDTAHYGTACKMLKGCTIQKCDIGVRVGTKASWNTPFDANSFYRCNTAIELVEDASKAYDILSIRQNRFLDSVNYDVTYSVPAGQDRRILMSQNFFGEEVNGSNECVSRPSKVSGNLQYSPYYMDYNKTVLSADLENAKDSNGNYNLPIYTDIAENKNINISDEVLEQFKNTSSGGSLVVPILEEGTLKANWSFDKDNLNSSHTSQDGIAMNLAISKEISNFMGSFGEYEAIHFAHSGKLPGIATVSVKKSANLDTNKPLYLYKLLDGQPIKQAETVAFEGDMLTFKRGDCSDYFISNVNTDDNTSSDSGSGGNDSSNDYTSSDTVIDAIKNATGNTVTVNVADRPMVGIDSFTQLGKNPNKELVLTGNGYSWRFSGKDMNTNIPGQIYINTKISNISPNSEKIAKAAGNKELINLYFSYQGKLPGKATITVAVPSKFEGKKLNVYCYNAAKDGFEKIKTGTVVKNGKLEFDITHCLEYVITPDTLTTVGVDYINPETGGYPFWLE